MKARALVLLGPGTNRDRDVGEAIELAGGEAVVVPISRLATTKLSDFGMLIIPGGFSYGDALGAGALLALDLERRFAEKVAHFVSSGRPVLGICNGFQALVKSGILPGSAAGRGKGELAAELGAPRHREREFTLARNARGDFECRWVRLAVPPSRSIWTRDLGTFACPVAHGEGRLVAKDAAALDRLSAGAQIALVYARADGSPADGAWPENPNGSARDIAGLCNAEGNVLGLMPHPENAMRPRTRLASDQGNDLIVRKFFENGIKFAQAL
ncbi:MAG TPA: phosphoribosylformylglycinamidine synthase I [Rectinemataceae bacterium]|nr:phosphoribosylformylglycinamidine synthase I [Rectinemataceae bacterium]